MWIWTHVSGKQILSKRERERYVPGHLLISKMAFYYKKFTIYIDLGLLRMYQIYFKKKLNIFLKFLIFKKMKKKLFIIDKF